MATLRIVFGGILQGAQGWSIGFDMATIPSSSPTPTQMSALANQLWDDFVAKAWSTVDSGSQKLSAGVNTGGNLAQCRTYFYATGATQALTVGASTRAALPGTGGANQAPQVALVATLLTDVAGRSGRGRVYLPAMAFACTADGHTGNITAGVAQSLANYITLANSRSFAGAAMTSIVAGATKSHQYPVRSVKVDNVFDTQRRRRDKITQTVTSFSAVIAP